MDIKEVSKLFGVKEHDKSMKNKTKAKEIIDKILKCNKCGSQMKWIENTNVCVCPNCTYTYGKKNKKDKKDTTKTLSISRTLSDKSRRFLENNYNVVAKESKEV